MQLDLTMNPEYIAELQDRAKQRQTMAKVWLQPMKERATRAAAGPMWAMLLNNFRVVWTERSFLLITLSAMKLITLDDITISKYGRADNKPFCKNVITVVILLA